LNDVPHSCDRFRFDLFEVDLHTGELWRLGRKLKLTGQPFSVLAMLLEKPNATRKASQQSDTTHGNRCSLVMRRYQKWTYRAFPQSMMTNQSSIPKSFTRGTMHANVAQLGPQV
jgi:hypothetical protein